TTVGQSPQRSVTVSGTVAAWPGVAWRTTKLVLAVFGGKGTVKLPVCPAGWPGTSMSALVACPIRSDTRLSGEAPELQPALIVACSRPAPLGTTTTPTAGRGLHWVGTGPHGPSKIVTLLLHPLATARSGNPSALKSPTATEPGLL